MSFKEPEGQIARWLQYLQTYTFEIVHRKGKSHLNAHSLSRRPCLENCSHCGRQERKEVGIKAIQLSSNVDMRNVQRQDKDISVILAWKEKHERPVWQDISEKSVNLKILWSQWAVIILHCVILLLPILRDGAQRSIPPPRRFGHRNWNGVN